MPTRAAAPRTTAAASHHEQTAQRAGARPTAWLVAWCLLVLACSAPASTAATTTSAPTTSSTAAAPEPFPGTVDEFYEVPDPLPPGEPGELIRVQDVASGGGITTKRIMYHSRDAADRDRAVTGIVSYPEGTPPPGGWPIVALAHGTVGMATQCAPSRGGGAAPTFGVEGVGVATDYVGLGPVGEIHPYLSRPSEAHSVVDSVRAARHLLGGDARAEWVVVGHSQGGHAALATNELAHDYAPELTLLGAVASAPGAVFDQVYDGIDPFVALVIRFMMLVGAAGEHPEIDLDHHLAPASAPARDAIETACLDQIIAAVLGVPLGQHFLHDPAETEPARSILLSNDVGRTASPSPLLVVAGTADTTVHIDRARELFARLCAAGQHTGYTEYEGADHGTITVQAHVQIEAWLADRIAGRDVPDACPEAPEPPTGASTTSTTLAPDPPDAEPVSRPLGVGHPAVPAAAMLAASTPARARPGFPALTG